MLTVIYGDNYTKKTKALEKIIESASFQVERVDALSYTSEELLAQASSISLFGQMTGLSIAHVQDNEELWKTLVKYIDVVAASKTLFLVISENNIDADILELLEKHGVKVLACPEDKKNVYTDRPLLSPFVLSDAIFAHDKKEAWVTFCKLTEYGVPVEEIENAIIWAMKTLTLVTKTNELPKDKQKTDLKPFVLSKVSRGLASWKNRDILGAYTACIVCVETYRFYDDYSLYLEKTLLEILS
jgi:DNA polymerase III delta subunit